MGDAFGNDDGTPPPPRESTFARVVCVSCGLPPFFPLTGITGDVFTDKEVGLGKMALELFLRSASGIAAGLPAGPELLLMLRLSRMCFMSVGIEIE